jgi:succinate dehydrogenase hydrophobic anchor subunit
MSWASYEPMQSIQPMAPPMNPGMMAQGQGQGQGQQMQMPGQMPHQLEQRPPIYNNPKNNNVEVPKAKAKANANANAANMEDVSEYENIYDWILITIAAIIVEVIVLCLVRFCPDIFGKAINIWFNRFKLSAVLADVLTIMIGFGITRYVYSEWLYPTYDWNPLYFTGLSAIVQMLYVSFFYFVVVRPTPQGYNTMIDALREVVSAGGSKILGSDALKMMGASVITMLLKSAPLHLSASIGILATYFVPFMLETKNTYSNIA